MAYGSKILLNNSRLHLRKGCKFGVISEKSAGKTTMMRAISNGQVEGFPTPAMCRSIFIENDIQGSQLKMNVRRRKLQIITCVRNSTATSKIHSNERDLI